LGKLLTRVGDEHDFNVLFATWLQYTAFWEDAEYLLLGFFVFVFELRPLGWHYLVVLEPELDDFDEADLGFPEIQLCRTEVKVRDGLLHFDL
jgi:hypothetical protein